MPRFKTMRQIPFPFKRIFGGTVLHFTKLELTVQCNLQLWSGFILTSVNSATHRKTILSGRASISSGKYPEGEGHYPGNLLSSAGNLPGIKSNKSKPTRDQVLPGVASKIWAGSSRTHGPSLDYGCLPVLRSVETLVAEGELLPKPGGPQVCAVGKALPPLLPAGPGAGAR
jgi:hypothetical protein